MRTPNNPYTDKTLEGLELPKPNDLPYKAVGDSLVIIPMEVKDDMVKSKLILTPGVGATNKQRLQSRLMKGLVVSKGEGVATDNGFIFPEHPDIGDIVYFEAHQMKMLPFHFALLKYESSLFVLDQNHPKAKEILESEVELSKKGNQSGLKIVSPTENALSQGLQ